MSRNTEEKMSCRLRHLLKQDVILNRTKMQYVEVAPLLKAHGHPVYGGALWEQSHLHP